MGQSYLGHYLRLLLFSTLLTACLWLVSKDVPKGWQLFGSRKSTNVYAPKRATQTGLLRLKHIISEPLITPTTINNTFKFGYYLNLSEFAGNNRFASINETITAQILPLNTSSQTPESSKLIVHWTKCFRKECPWGKRGANLFRDCLFKKCDIANDKSRVNDASMVLFHHRDEVSGFPSVRHQRQLYAHYTFEPPARMDFTFLDVYEGRLNMTVSYRQDGNLFIPFGRAVKRDNISTEPFTCRVPFQNKTRGAVWLVSHCHALSGRDDYVNELRKYLNIDVFGKCGNMTCPANNKCLEYFEENYKFYLAFENAICKDYVTEKLFNALTYELVPVVLGATNYTRVLPAKSFIDVRDFETPKQLAEYLIILGKNETEYLTYFDWKRRYVVRKEHMPAMFCELCKFLHLNSNTSQTIQPPYTRSYREWFQSTCRNDMIENMETRW